MSARTVVRYLSGAFVGAGAAVLVPNWRGIVGAIFINVGILLSHEAREEVPFK